MSDVQPDRGLQRLDRSASPNRLLVPFTLAAFLGFLSVGIPLPVLALFVHDRLGYSPFVCGLVVGLQSLATLLSRSFAGRLCDTRGAKPATLLGLGTATAAGLCYAAATLLAASPGPALAVLLLGRLVLGVAESLFITALAAWSVARVGSAHAGRAMAWSGIAMYGALAIGAPIGAWIYGAAGFGAVALCVVLVPLCGAAVTFGLERVPAETAAASQPSYLMVLRRIWAPGLGMALASSGVGTISAFLALHYRGMDWPGIGYAFTAFGFAYIVMRLLFGGLPDRIGGVLTATGSLAVEATGLLTIWLAPSPAVALLGAMLTGLGYSLVFPSLGVEAMKRASSQSRGLVLGAYLACFDLGIAMAGPLAGGVAQGLGVRAVFPAAAIAALSALALTALTRLRQTPS